MKLPRKADRSTVVVGVSLTLLALVFLYIVLLFWSMRQDFASEIDAVAPLIAGVTASERAAVFPLMKFFIAEPGLSSAPSLANAAARRSAIIAEPLARRDGEQQNSAHTAKLA